MKRPVDILDVTIRDGSYAIDYRYTPLEVAAIVEELDRAGISHIEVSHGCGLGARELGMPAAASDAEYVRAARSAARSAKIGVIANPEPFTTHAQIDEVIGDVDFIRFAANVGSIDRLESNIAYALSRGVEVFVQMMRSSRRPPDDVFASAAKAQDLGVTAIYLVDTTGHFIPQDVHALVSHLKQKMSVRIGFHAHNNLGLAIATTTAAIDAGADMIDASLRGIGRAAGNAQLEAVVSLMKRQGLAQGIDLDRLLDAGERLIAPLMPKSAGIAAVDVAMGDANIDVYPLPVFERFAEAAGVDLRTFIRRLALHKEAVEVDMPLIGTVLEEFGADPHEVFKRLGIPTT